MVYRILWVGQKLKMVMADGSVAAEPCEVKTVIPNSNWVEFVWPESTKWINFDHVVFFQIVE